MIGDNMSAPIRIVLAAMRMGREYGASDLVGDTLLSEDLIARALTLLCKGRLIEKTKDDKYTKGRKYKTNQMQLAIGR